MIHNGKPPHLSGACRRRLEFVEAFPDIKNKIYSNRIKYFKEIQCYLILSSDIRCID